jgi:hypothetical protein
MKSELFIETGIEDLNSNIRKVLKGLEDIVIVPNFVNNHGLFEKLNQEIQLFADQTCALRTKDGFFAPHPYSTIRKDASCIDPYSNYIQSNAELLKSERVFNFQQGYDNFFQDKLNMEKLTLPSFPKFNSFGFRTLFKGENGIDIHCENAFINQLDNLFTAELYQNIDIENAISIFVILDKDERDDKDLSIYGMDWREAKIELNNTSYEERHDEKGSIFTNRSFRKPEISFIDLKVGDLIFFRAAQLWHSVSRVNYKNRVSLGSFIALDKNNNLKYWA